MGTNHALATQLWNTKVHEAMILAAFIDDPLLVSEEQMEQWVNGFSSWDICDAVFGTLFDKTRFAYKIPKFPEF
ncbi:MAG: DNA alkylation repair protein [Candidatus Micrarchaeia archaeon]